MLSENYRFDDPFGTFQLWLTLLKILGNIISKFSKRAFLDRWAHMCLIWQILYCECPRSSSMLAFAIYIFTDRIPVWADNLLCIDGAAPIGSSTIVYICFLLEVTGILSVWTSPSGDWNIWNIMEHLPCEVATKNFWVHFDPFWVCKVAHKKSFPISGAAWNSCLWPLL